jgi:endonuclease YncB( thermonuclease family)
MGSRLLSGAITLALLGGSAFVGYDAFTGQRLHVVDGDTFDLDGERIRVWGIQAPEMRDPGGKAAKAGLQRILVAPVSCERKYLDPFERTVAQCFSGGKDIAAELVRQGFAVDWPYYSGGYYAR